MSQIDQAKREAAEALFDEVPPHTDAYDDSTPVTVELTKGQLYILRAALRQQLNARFGALDQREMFAELFGESFALADEEVRDTHRLFDASVTIDGVLAEQAPMSDYPNEGVEEAEPELAEAPF